MNTLSTTEQLFNTMIQFGKLMAQSTSESHEEHIATKLQFFALQLLKDQPNSTVGDLARSMQLSKSSATQLVERLKKTKLVKRVHDKEDRRIIRLVITPEGEEEVIILKKKIIGKMNVFFSKIPPQDIQELIRIHTNLISTLKQEQKKLK